ncbi:hypothetical protein [Microcoleus sp. EPA2]|uniref:hypothetical protein n=1 Tax=Microcoleus sp. EPA2 TaxID=2841654 RepID=UPI00312B75E6
MWPGLGVVSKCKKPGFCDSLGIITEMVERNPVSKALMYQELCITAEKPGFCDNLGIITEMVERNPVSKALMYQELCITAEKPGFCDNFCIITESGKKPGF